MTGGPGVPKTYLYGVKREGLEFDSPLQEWIPITVDSTGELRTLPVVFNAFGDEQFPVINRLRGNENPVLIPGDTYTATQASSTVTNVNARGAHIVVTIASVSGAEITVRIQGLDPFPPDTPSNWYDILVSNPITSTGTTILKVYPGINTVPNGASSDILPWQWRVLIEHADANDIEYAISANMVV